MQPNLFVARMVAVRTGWHACPEEDPMIEAVVLRSAQCARTEAAWGTLTWHASAALGNSTQVTVGTCVIHPGDANPRHSHPNCTEILTVRQGTVLHSIGSQPPVTLYEGDTITVPQGMVHNARNTGCIDAELRIVFTSADRQTKGE